MTPRTTSTLIAAAIVLLGAWLYLSSLSHVPPYLIHDEAQGALQAHAIATTAHDLSGRFLPLYFTEPEFPPGRDPALIYVTALGLKVLPFTEAGARTPTALVAVLDLVLMFLAARAIFQSTWAGVIAAVMLALTPVHFIRGRLMLSPLYSVPFVLGWLWSLARFNGEPTVRRFIQACAWLAAGMYSYLAAVVMMPLYALMTIGVAARSLRWRTIMLAGVTFVVILLPMAAWYLTHPERNAQIVSAYQLSATAGGSRIAMAMNAIGKYLNLYWTFFDPAYLFVSGDASVINSTRTSGLFPLAFALLVPIGLVTLLRKATPLGLVLVGGFLAAPAVSVVSGAIEMNRVMFAIPFAVLVAMSGAGAMWESRSWVPRAFAALLIASVAWQFAVFHRTYLSDGYRLSSATWYSGNVREAVRELIARSGDNQIYVSKDIEWVHRMWRFYAIEAGRLDLVGRTTYVDEPPVSAPAGSQLLCPTQSARCMASAASGAWKRIVDVDSFDGSHHYAILERVAPANPGR